MGTPYQLWREEHMKQELGAHKSVIGSIESLPTTTAKISMEVIQTRPTTPGNRMSVSPGRGDKNTTYQSPRRLSEPPTKNIHPRSYILKMSQKKRWRLFNGGSSIR